LWSEGPKTTPYENKKNKIRGLTCSEASPNTKPHSHAKLDTSPPLSYTRSKCTHTSSALSLFSRNQISRTRNPQELSINISTSTIGGSSFLHNGNHNNKMGGRPSTSPMAGTTNSNATMDDLMKEFNRLPWGRRNIAVGKAIRRRGHSSSTHRISPSICSSPLSINLKNATSPVIGEKNREVVESMIPPLRPDEFPIRNPEDFDVKSVLS
jgi:hypothetical protein